MNSIQNVWPHLSEQWKNNPLVKLMVGRVKPWAIWIIVFQLTMAAFSFVMVFVTTGSTGFKGIGLIFTVLLSMMGLLALVLQCVAPIFYADWAYKQVWERDETI
ncbi:MAG: hypothetical protein ABI579_03460, partial [Candidatus Sumerlaeota bacterium]